MLISNNNLRAPDVLARPDEWMARAACHQPGVDPDVMYPEAKDEKGAAAARKVCQPCPVAVECLMRTMQLEGATKHMRFGIVAGTGIGHRQALYEQVQSGRTTLRDGAERLVDRVLNQPTTLADVFEARTGRPDTEGHVAWLLQKTTLSFQGCVYTPMQLAFLLGLGRPAKGTIRAGCGVTGCVAWPHLTDAVIRLEQRRARAAEKVEQAKAAAEARPQRRRRGAAALPRERFEQYARPMDGPGQHTTWAGPKSVKLSGERYTPRQVAFLAGYGRLPQGHVTAACLVRECHTPGHMADGPMRLAAQARSTPTRPAVYAPAA